MALGQTVDAVQERVREISKDSELKVVQGSQGQASYSLDEQTIRLGPDIIGGPRERLDMAVAMLAGAHASNMRVAQAHANKPQVDPVLQAAWEGASFGKK